MAITVPIKGNGDLHILRRCALPFLFHLDLGELHLEDGLAIRCGFGLVQRLLAVNGSYNLISKRCTGIRKEARLIGASVVPLGICIEFTPVKVLAILCREVVLSLLRRFDIKRDGVGYVFLQGVGECDRYLFSILRQGVILILC